jgi:hypothetical protein
MKNCRHEGGRKGESQAHRDQRHKASRHFLFIVK